MVARLLSAQFVAGGHGGTRNGGMTNARQAQNYDRQNEAEVQVNGDVLIRHCKGGGVGQRSTRHKEVKRRS